MHPYVSPLFGDFTRGWPPTLLTTGTRDLLLSDTVRMHRALGERVCERNCTLPKQVLTADSWEPMHLRMLR